jgi:hypothetical protein
MSRIRLALFPDRAAAAPIHERLVAAGIAAEIHQELQWQLLWFVSKSAAGARLEVKLEQLPYADRLVREWDLATQALRRAIRCPECHSLRVDFPQFTRKSLLTNLAIGLLTELRLVERQYYCEDCHFMWSKSQSEHPRPRAHQAPNYFIEGLEDQASEDHYGRHLPPHHKRGAA